MTLLALVGPACATTIDKEGVGQECRRAQDCLSGLSCIARLCTAPAKKGDAERAKEQLVCVVDDPRDVCQPDAGS